MKLTDLKVGMFLELEDKTVGVVTKIAPELAGVLVYDFAGDTLIFFTEIGSATDMLLNNIVNGTKKNKDEIVRIAEDINFKHIIWNKYLLSGGEINLLKEYKKQVPFQYICKKGHNLELKDKDKNVLITINLDMLCVKFGGVVEDSDLEII